MLEKNDPSRVAAEALDRISEALGDKVTITASSQVINELVKHEDWKFRQAGFLFLAMISATCSKTIRKNMDEIFTMNFNGLLDQHPRVRYQALMSIGLIMNELSPDFQNKFHLILMPQMFKMMHEESFIKLKAQVVSTTCCFVRGLTDFEDEE